LLICIDEDKVEQWALSGFDPLKDFGQHIDTGTF
jgi:hypothetical protein